MLSLKNKWIIAGSVVIVIALSLSVREWISYKKSLPIDPLQVIEEKVILNNTQSFTVFHQSKPEKGLVVYIGDAHKRRNNEDYAKKFASLSYYVVAINSDYFLKTNSNAKINCINFSETMSGIISELQNHFDLDSDNLPILVGTDEGAALVYATLAQSEKHSFHAAISINFSAQFDASLPACALHNLTSSNTRNLSSLNAVKHLPASWYLFQDPSNNANHLTSAFANKISNAKLTIADGKEQTSLSEAIQILQWLDPRLEDQISSDNSDGDLPLIEVPVDENTPPPPNQTTMALILTGDGGWAEIDKNIAQILADKGIPTVALDSLSYFWKTRTPEATAKDIEDTIALYFDKWHKQQVILIGYSFGADVMPFIANKLSPETRKSVALIALLGIGKTAAFEFHLSSWMNADKDPNRKPLLPEIDKMHWANSICIYGILDSESNCSATEAYGVKVISMSGDHHFDKKYDELVGHIIDNANYKNTENH